MSTYTRHLCASWVPRILKDSERQRQVLESLKFVRRATWDPTFLDRVITFDQTWLCLYDSENKSQSKHWTPIGDQPPTNHWLLEVGKDLCLSCSQTSRECYWNIIYAEYFSKVSWFRFHLVVSCFMNMSLLLQIHLYKINKHGWQNWLLTMQKFIKFHCFVK